MATFKGPVVPKIGPGQVRPLTCPGVVLSCGHLPAAGVHHRSVFLVLVSYSLLTPCISHFKTTTRLSSVYDCGPMGSKIVTGCDGVSHSHFHHIDHIDSKQGCWFTVILHPQSVRPPACAKTPANVNAKATCGCCAPSKHGLTIRQALNSTKQHATIPAMFVRKSIDYSMRAHQH